MYGDLSHIRNEDGAFDIAPPHRYILGQPGAGALPRQLEKLYDAVSPRWLGLDTHGALAAETPDKEEVKRLKEAGVRVIPSLCSNWSRQAATRALEAGTSLARELGRLVVEQDWNGIQINLNSLGHLQMGEYTRFVEKVRQAVPRQREISVAVAANPYGWRWGWQGSYDYEGLACRADYLTVMAWDQHFQGGECGPVAGLDYTGQAIRYALEHVPPDKVVLGLPLYGRIWSRDGGVNGWKVPLHQAEDILGSRDCLILHDPAHQSPKASFTLEEDTPALQVGGKVLKPGAYTLWYENAASITAKLELADRYGLKGCAFRRPGQQSGEVEAAIRKWRFPLSAAGEKAPVAGKGAGISRRRSLNAKSRKALPTPATTLYATGSICVPGAILRRAPREESRAAASLQEGLLFILLEKQEGWHKVLLLRGDTGYVAEEQVRVHPVGVVTPRGGTRILSAPGEQSGQIIAHAVPGTAMAILEEGAEGWCKVRLADKRVGYARDAHLARTPYRQPILLRCATQLLKLRDAPSSDAESLGALPAGEQVLVLEGGRPGYTKIAHGSLVAFVTQGYLRE